MRERERKKNPIKCNTVDYIANLFFSFLSFSSLSHLSNLRSQHSKVLQCFSARRRPFSAIYRVVGIMQGKLSNFSKKVIMLSFISFYSVVFFFFLLEFAFELVADNELELQSSSCHCRLHLCFLFLYCLKMCALIGMKTNE